MEKTTFLSANQELKNLFKKIRNELMDQDKITVRKFSDFVMVEDQRYECAEGLERIRNAFYGRSADYKLTELLKRYRDEKA